MKISRNARCPCGSGKKYKKCCGSDEIVDRNKQDSEPEHFITERIPHSPDIPSFSEEFFQDLDTTGVSSHKLLYSCILRPEIEAVAASYSNTLMKRGKSEAELIKSCKSTSDLIELMKNGLDNLNHVLIRSRLLENPSEAVELLISELGNPTRDDFVELAIRTIAETEVDVSRDLIAIIERHEKSAYQISVLCLLLGFYRNSNIPQFLWNYFCYFRNRYPSENYWRGPFYGLWENWAGKENARKTENGL